MGRWITESQGFEPWEVCTLAGFQGRCIRPLCQLSSGTIIDARVSSLPVCLPHSSYELEWVIYTIRELPHRGFHPDPQGMIEVRAGIEPAESRFAGERVSHSANGPGSSRGTLNPQLVGNIER